MSSPTPQFDFTLVGDANLDLLLYGLAEELPLERELLASSMALRLGGSAAITAHNLAALGNQVGFIATSADDDLGKLCRTELSTAGVDLSRCPFHAEAQTGVTVILQHQSRRHMFTYPGATFDLAAADLDLPYLTRARHFHMASYYLQRALTPQISAIFAQLKQAGLTISLDTNDDPSQQWDRSILDALPYVDILLPNEREACLLAGIPNLPDAIEFLRHRVPLLVIKRGAAGATAYTPTTTWSAPSTETEVVDAVGAGDSFNAGFLHAWIRSWPTPQALEFGNLIGGHSTTAIGGTTAFRNPATLQKLQATFQSNQSPATPA